MSPSCWTYSGNASHLTSGSCSPTALFSGGGSGVVYQSFAADHGGSYFYMDYVIDLNDPHATWQDELDIDILDAGGYPLLHVATYTGGPGTISCESHNISLGYHPSWAGQTIKVQISVYEAYSNVTFKLGGVHVWQGIS